jgi:uracil-DNA glycosylase family protein
VTENTADAFLPKDHSLRSLAEAVQRCEGCDLYRHATQAVFGEGTEHAKVMLVGEQPGDREDIEGHPFVGPAGAVLDRGLEAAGIARADAYVTNIVKHFRWKPAPRGKRRIHRKPDLREQLACRPWLVAELEQVQPKVLVCLGATAAQSLLGRSFRVTKERGRFVESDLAPFVTTTVHPSSILRAPDDAARAAAMDAFVDDLKKVTAVLRRAA